MSFANLKKKIQTRNYYEEKSIMADKINVDIICVCVQMMLKLSDNNFFRKFI